LGEEGGLFQVAVCDVPVGVVGGDQGGLHVFRERVAPVETLACVVEVHAAHARPSGIGGPKQRGLLRDQFRQVCGASAQARGQAAKGVDAAADEAVEAHSVLAGLVLRPLQSAEQRDGSGNGRCHETKLAQHAAPFLCADPLDVAQFREDLLQGLLAVGWQLDGLSHSVNDPT
jgi:hypothetical protein